jgi:hypothetical protein
LEQVELETSTFVGWKSFNIFNNYINRWRFWWRWSRTCNNGAGAVLEDQVEELDICTNSSSQYVGKQEIVHQ